MRPYWASICAPSTPFLKIPLSPSLKNTQPSPFYQQTFLLPFPFSHSLFLKIPLSPSSSLPFIFPSTLPPISSPCYTLSTPTHPLHLLQGMPPRTKNQGPSRSTSSFDRHRFTTSEHAERFEALLSRKVIQEKQVQFSGGRNDPIFDQFEVRGWRTLSSLPPSMKVITQEFYANAFKPDTQRFTSYVRGKEVPFSATAIQRVLRTRFRSSSSSCQYQHYLDTLRLNTDVRVPMAEDADCPYQHFLDVIAQPGVQWDTQRADPTIPHKITAGQLNAEATFWHRLSIFNLLPINHSHDVNVPRAALLCTIMTGDPIDICTVLANDIYETIYNRPTNASLGHSALIQELCRQAGVDIPSTGERLAFKRAINTTDFIDHPIPASPAAVADESEAVGPNSHTRSYDERLDRLEARSTYTMQLLQTLLTHQGIPFPPFNDPHPQAPPPPAEDPPSSSS